MKEACIVWYRLASKGVDTYEMIRHNVLSSIVIGTNENYIHKLDESHVKTAFIILMSNLVNEFNDYRTKMNEVILSKENLVIKRLWNLDTNTYAAGALDVKTKELLGLVASMVLRCDDCIKYHLGKSHELGVNTEEMYEVFAVANIVGGTIVVPHTRRAAEYWEALEENNQ